MFDPIIPPEEQRFLDSLRLTREDIYRAWKHGRLYGRCKAHSAISALPSVFGAFDHEPLTIDNPDLDLVEPILRDRP